MKAHVSNGCKPCPFCGAPVTVRLMRKGPDFIACTNKQECGAIVSFNNTPCDCFGASPVDYFNRRASTDEIALVEDAPAVVPDVQRWRDPDKDPPKVETEVLILYRNDIDGYGITTAHYEDGSVFLQDSVWYWEDLPDWGTYDEERDDYKIPKGWREYRHFNPDEVYNNKIDRPVVGWMPLPEKLKKEGVA